MSSAFIEIASEPNFDPLTHLIHEGSFLRLASVA